MSYILKAKVHKWFCCDNAEIEVDTWYPILTEFEEKIN